MNIIILILFTMASFAACMSLAWPETNASLSPPNIETSLEPEAKVSSKLELPPPLFNDEGHALIPIEPVSFDEPTIAKECPSWREDFDLKEPDLKFNLECGSDPPECCCPQPCPEPCCNLNMNGNAMDPGFNATARIDLEKSAIFSLWGSFIYWQADQSLMEVGLKSSFAINNTCCGISWKDGKMIQIDTGFTPGFQIGVGYGFCYDHWDLFAEYTRFHTHGKAEASLNPDGFLYARWIQPNLISNSAVTRLSTDWRLGMDVLNAELERRFYVGRKLIWTPHFGLTAAWIDQKFKGNFSLISPHPFELHVHSKSESWAIGPRIGIQSNWYLGCRFSILADIAADLLYTHYDLDLHQWAKDDVTIFMHSSNDFNTLRPEMDLFLGLGYDYYSCNHCFRTNIQIGYDFQVWWDQNMIRWYNDSTYISAPIGNLYIQGLTLTFRFDF